MNRWGVMLLVAAVVVPWPAAACEPSRREPAGLRVGVVFSGGGAKAAFEAGVA
jgi:hypothetical protein